MCVQEAAYKQLLQELGQLRATIVHADEESGLVVASIPYKVRERAYLWWRGNAQGHARACAHESQSLHIRLLKIITG